MSKPGRFFTAGEVLHYITYSYSCHERDGSAWDPETLLLAAEGRVRMRGL